ncbi:uncharacterized protein LACBIDRAFT_312661 [Laccaria bicolor S238N-H82]|uniref:Predicted protein n=1 Tax=Laccaria bicolor (strain S238N-H82 / ATCC MYA-4686) TaxID=486041 RepID=B0DWK5_LACBS|nr:uncharacterized protein LACBIDRAFT_312661 [Laccaria bicolor S238N-H82]EDR01062.1 predicted protein [Laccaria bicolor S238N-H82]|eukprot:XP_001888281.1 predicted protein [Laccaria bicolor S238N-H82]
MPRRNGNGATSQYVQPVCFESLGSHLDFHPTRPNTHALFYWVGGTPVLERVMAPGTSTSSTATTFAGVNHVDAHFHDNLGLLSSSVCFHSSRNFTFFFQSRSTFATGASISYLGVAPHKFLTCPYKVIFHLSQSQCTP